MLSDVVGPTCPQLENRGPSVVASSASAIYETIVDFRRDNRFASKSAFRAFVIKWTADGDPSPITSPF